MDTIKVVAAIIKKENKILIAKRKNGAFAGMYEFPGGKIKFGETDKQALIREIQEELETTISVDKYFMNVNYKYPNFILDMNCYLCSLKDNHIKLNDHTSIKWITLNEQNINWIPADIQIIKKLQTRNLIMTSTLQSNPKLHTYNPQPKLLLNNYKQGIKVSHELITQLNACEAFYFSVAFINKSGLAVLKQTLIDLKDKGIRGKIITSTYLGFNHPNVFKELLIFDNIEVRIYEDEQIGFHPKGYIFKNNNNYKIIIGSSNLTQSALATNQEWNIMIDANSGNDFVEEINNEFKLQWQHSVPLTKEWIEEYEKTYIPKSIPINHKHQNIQPNLMQQEALISLNALKSQKKIKHC
ncbi:MAG: NUDIX domain-containing protein [Thomasclavelia sp.]